MLSVKLVVDYALVFAGLALAGSAVVSAQTPPPAGTPPKPSSINIQAAILSTKEGQQATRNLNQKFGPRRQALEKRQADLAALQSRMRAGSATMSPAAKDKLIAEIDSQTKSWNLDSSDFNTEMQQEEGKAINEIGQRMIAVIEKYALQHGISFVADVSNPRTPLIWADPSVDITSDIVKLYDETHPVAPEAKKP